MKHIFGAIADWVEDKVRDRKLRWLIAIPSAVATLLVVFGITAAIQPLANVSLLTLSIFLLIVVVTLGINRRYLRRELGQNAQVLRTYGEKIRRAQEGNGDLFHTTEWNEAVFVTNKGDTTIIRDITVRIGPDPVSAIWSLATRNSDEHQSPAVRDRVRVEACYMDDSGVEGTRIVTTKWWEGDSKLRI